jgi:hypothetical protein
VAEHLRVDLAEKVTSLIATEEQLRQEQGVRQQVGARLRQEWTALADAQTALERERMAREEA